MGPRFQEKRRFRTCATVAAVLVLCLTAQTGFAGASAGQVQQIVNGADQTWMSRLINGMFNNVLYALTAWLELGLYGVWLVVTWSVVRLYSGIGTYLIPIWDFTNGSGFFQTGEAAARAAVEVPPAAAQLLQSMVPWILSLCGLLMFGLAALGIPSYAKDSEEPFAAIGGLAVSAGLMVAFPLLYSVPIHVGDFLGREFYEASHVRYAETAGWGTNGTPPSLFSILIQGSVFPNSVEGTGPPGSSLSTAVGSALQGATSGITQAPSAVTETAQLEGAYNYLNQQLASGGNISLAWSAAKDAVMYNLETQASRFIQVILGIMALVALVGLLMLKGGQIVALVLSYYLGWIACALYVHPATRPVFGLWLKNHLKLCLWGFLWAALIFVMDILVVGCQDLPGMTPLPGTPGAFMDVGMFLMPFMLFAAVHKFKSVGELADSMTATGRIASAAGRSVHEAFDAGLRRVPSDVIKAGGRGSVHGKLGQSVIDMSKTFAVRMERLAASASAAASTWPGVGPMAAWTARQAFLNLGETASSVGQIMGTAIRGVNRFHGAPKEESDWLERSQERPKYFVQDLRPPESR